MESALGTLLEWAEEYGFGINPPRNVLVTFTRKYKDTSFTLSHLDGNTKEAKYLDAIFDSKLSCNGMLEKAFFQEMFICSRKLMEKKNGV